MKSSRVLIIYTGGTIGMGRNPRTGTLEPLDFNYLLANLPEMQYLETSTEVYQFDSPIDSSDMNPAIWAKLVRIIVGNYDRFDGFVILHGTDTMSYTASALSFMLSNLTKPVILTGSQLPIGQLRTDGKENLVTSIELAATCDNDGRPMVPEVCIYFSGKLIRGNRSTKQHADGFNAFDSFNYPHLCDAGVNFKFNRHVILKPDYDKPLCPYYEMDANIVVFSLFPGIQEPIVRHMLDAPELKGIVMRTYGSGNAMQEGWLLNALRSASERGVTIVNISQCVAGSVEMSRYDTGYQLQQAGIISGRDSTVEAAATKLMHLHARFPNDVSTINKLMETSMAGEITVAP